MLIPDGVVNAPSGDTKITNRTQTASGRFWI